MTTLTDRTFRPKLEIVECEGMGRYFEVIDDGEYVGTFDGDGSGYRREEDDWNGLTLCQRFGGRVAYLYGFAAYDAECAAIIAADPEGFDTSDVVPDPFLVTVRRTPKGATVEA